MTRLRECRHEPDAVAAVRAGRLTDAELTRHVAACAVCREVVEVAEAMASIERETLGEVRLPSAGSIWWRAQVRARQDAARAASRPVVVAQAVGAAAVLGLLAALLSWQWPALSAAAGTWVGVGFTAPDLGLAAWALVAAAAVLGPVAVYVAVARE